MMRPGQPTDPYAKPMMGEMASMAPDPYAHSAGRAPDVGAARSWLGKAIARHERHLSGEEPTDPASQQAMMGEMAEALRALGPDEAGQAPQRANGPQMPMPMPMRGR
jgi:hypothetical protein